jgi:hypothetical protein
MPGAKSDRLGQSRTVLWGKVGHKRGAVVHMHKRDINPLKLYFRIISWPCIAQTVVNTVVGYLFTRFLHLGAPYFVNILFSADV